MKEITITQERYDELLKQEYALETLKAYANNTSYLSNEVVNTILTVNTEKRVETSDDDF